MPGVAIATLGRVSLSSAYRLEKTPPALLLVETKKFD